jgi:hypothetical protein
MKYQVLVDDNFHYLDEKERYELGRFDSAEAAVDAARRIVDDYLQSALQPGMRADQLFAAYALFGRDPFVVGAGDDVAFSAFEYARERCRALCAAAG